MYIHKTLRRGALASSSSSSSLFTNWPPEYPSLGTGTAILVSFGHVVYYRRRKELSYTVGLSTLETSSGNSSLMRKIYGFGCPESRIILSRGRDQSVKIQSLPDQLVHPLSACLGLSAGDGDWARTALTIIVRLATWSLSPIPSGFHPAFCGQSWRSGINQGLNRYMLLLRGRGVVGAIAPTCRTDPGVAENRLIIMNI
jgi:hypothetical protein